MNHYLANATLYRLETRAALYQVLSADWAFDARVYYRSGQFELASMAQEQAARFHRAAVKSYASDLGA